MIVRICILVNEGEEFHSQELLRHYLPSTKFEVVVTDKFPQNPKEFKLIVPWSYRKIIKDTEEYGNIVVVHSSKLPEGRGWAPIYNAFSENQKEYVISAIFAADLVDTGDIIASAQFAMEPEYTATFIRKIDEEISLLLISNIAEEWHDCKPIGVKQQGIGNFRARRYANDNEIDINKTLKENISHLRGVESTAPAFFYFENTKYTIEIRPENVPQKPKNVIIKFPALNKTKIWSDWM